MERFVKDYKRMFHYYFVFDGRTSRMQFMGAVLINILAGLALELISLAIPFLHVVTWLYGLAVIIPLTAMTVRRLHDVNKSGWWVLIGIVPLLNLLLVVYCCMAEGTGRNRFGSMPLDN